MERLFLVGGDIKEVIYKDIIPTAILSLLCRDPPCECTNFNLYAYFLRFVLKVDHNSLENSQA